MKLLLRVGVMVLVACASDSAKQRDVTREAPAGNAAAVDAIATLRLAMLRHAPIDETGDEPVLMLLDMPGGASSLFAANNGDASIYYNHTGGAIIGGGGHAHINAAAVKLLREAARHKSAMVPVTAFPLPKAGSVRFYVRTPQRVYMAEASLDDLLSDRSPLSALFGAGMDVLLPLAELETDVANEKPPK